MSDEVSDLPERLVAENVSEVIWLRLRRLTSYQLCRKIIERRTKELTEEVIDRKAKGMSWAIRSALGYWDTTSGGLNAKILSRYYALLQVSIAEQIASNDPADDLPSIQRHTEFGHGLFTLQKPDIAFPENFLIGCLSSGHFAAYARKLNIDLANFSFPRRPREITKIEDSEFAKLISLSDLIRRVPELQAVIPEYLGVGPLSFQIGFASRNHSIRSKRMASHAQKTGVVLFDPPQEGEAITTYVAIYPHGYEISADELNKFGFSIKNIVKETEGLVGRETYYVGEIVHAPPI